MGKKNNEMESNPRKKGKNKSRKTYEKYGKHTNRHNRINQEVIDKRPSTETQPITETPPVENKLYKITGPEIANQLAVSLCLQSLIKN
jgi:hypothetical protein